MIWLPADLSKSVCEWQGPYANIFSDVFAIQIHIGPAGGWCITFWLDIQVFRVNIAPDKELFSSKK